VTGSTYIAAILMGRVSMFRLRIEQGSKLPFDNINPEDNMAWQNSARTEQSNKLPFDNISPCGSEPNL